MDQGLFFFLISVHSLFRKSNDTLSKQRDFNRDCQTTGGGPAPQDPGPQDPDQAPSALSGLDLVLFNKAKLITNNPGPLVTEFDDGYAGVRFFLPLKT